MALYSTPKLGENEEIAPRSVPTHKSRLSWIHNVLRNTTPPSQTTATPAGRSRFSKWLRRRRSTDTPDSRKSSPRSPPCLTETPRKQSHGDENVKDETAPDFTEDDTEGSTQDEPVGLQNTCLSVPAVDAAGVVEAPEVSGCEEGEIGDSVPASARGASALSNEGASASIDVNSGAPRIDEDEATEQRVAPIPVRPREFAQKDFATPGEWTVHRVSQRQYPTVSQFLYTRLNDDSSVPTRCVSADFIQPTRSHIPGYPAEAYARDSYRRDGYLPFSRDGYPRNFRAPHYPPLPDFHCPPRAFARGRAQARALSRSQSNRSEIRFSEGSDAAYNSGNGYRSVTAYQPQQRSFEAWNDRWNAQRAPIGQIVGGVGSIAPNDPDLRGLALRAAKAQNLAREKRREEYEYYLRTVPRESRSAEDPKTPRTDGSEPLSIFHEQLLQPWTTAVQRKAHSLKLLSFIRASQPTSETSSEPPSEAQAKTFEVRVCEIDNGPSETP